MSSFGEELKRERELRQISLREVAEATKISFRYLEALEANQFDELPGGVFNRGFVRAYSQYIGIDPEAMVTSYLMEEQERQSASDAREDAKLLRRSAAFDGPQANRLASLTSEQLRWGLAAIIVVIVITSSLLLWSWLAPDDDDETTKAEPVGKGALTPSGSKNPRTSAAVKDSDAAVPERPSATPREDNVATRAPSATRAAALSPAAPPQRAGTTPSPSSEPGAEPDVRPAARPEDDPPIPPGSPAVPAGGGHGVRTRIRVVREASGRVNCDDTRIEMLAGVRAGTTVEFLCKRFLVIDTSDAGAVALGLGDGTLAPLGPDGERLSSHRIDLSGRNTNGSRP